MHSRHHADKWQQTTPQKSLKASRPKFRAVQNTWVAQVSVLGSKGEERGVWLTMWMKEIIRGVPGCFMGRRQPRIVGEEYGGAVIVFSGRGGRRFVWTRGVNAVKVAELAYLQPGCARMGDYRQRLHVTRLTASSHVGFEGSPSLAGLGLHLTQLWLHKDNGWQTSRPWTSNKAVGDSQRAAAPV